MREREAARVREQAKEEMYDRMMNPHLYGGDGAGGGAGGGVEGYGKWIRCTF